MIIQQLDELATRAQDRYNAFTDRLRAFYASALLSRDMGTVALINRVENEAEFAVTSFLRDEWLAIKDRLQEIAVEAHRATLAEIESIESSDLTDAASEHVRASVEYLFSELHTQVLRDVATLKRTLQRAALEISISSRSRGVNVRSAAMEFAIGNTADIEFSFHDRASRKWKSAAFVRSTWRHTALSVYNEVVLFTLADHGLRHAQVFSVSPGAASHLMLISLSSNAEIPTYSEIRETVFHPNANAFLMMEGADVQA